MISRGGRGNTWLTAAALSFAVTGCAVPDEVKTSKRAAGLEYGGARPGDICPDPENPECPDAENPCPDPENPECPDAENPCPDPENPECPDAENPCPDPENPECPEAENPTL